MNQQERQIIESLFARLRQVGQQSPARDPEAEQLINDSLRDQPGASYYLAQTVVAQERALEAAQARINELERDVYTRGSGGFLGSLFGGRSHSYRSSPHQSYRAGPWTVPSGRQYGYGASMRPRASGGGFLAGAAQTAMGVAGGVLIGNLIASAFMDNEAAAAPEYDPGVAPGEDTGAAGSEVGGDEGFGDFGSDFGVDEF